MGHLVIPSFLDPNTLHLLDRTIVQIYVYVDYTLEEKPRPYYVGIGSFERVLGRHRNEIHTSIVKEWGIRRTVITTFPSKQEANELEIRLTAELKTQYGVEGHWGANKTRGGGGIKDYKYTTEQKQRAREAQRPVRKPVVQYAFNGDIVAIHESQCEASRVTGVPEQNINHCCKRRLKSAGRFIWRRVGDTFEHRIVKKPQNVERPKTRRAVIQLTLTGEFIAKHAGINIAKQATGVSAGNIWSCCKGTRKSASGYLWWYAT